MLETILPFIEVIVSAALSAGACYKIINYRLTSIENRLDKHNEYAEKFADCQKNIAVISTDIKNIREDISEMKSKN